MATYWVRSTGGNDANDGLSYDNAFATIGEAFDNVSQGDTLNVVADGDHDMPSFSDALTVQAGFAGTDYVTDPGLVVQGVDASGDPALATIKAPDATNCYFFYNMTSAADYIWVKGIKFDYSFFGTNAGTIRGIFYATSSLPPNFKLSSCYFDFGALDTTLTQDTVWDVFNQATASNSQVGSPGTWVIEYCYFRNAVIGVPDVGYVGGTVHHCIFNIQATNYSNAAYAISGGQFYKDTREQRWYNNTFIRLEDTSDQAGGLVTINNSDVSEHYLYNNIYYIDCGPSASTALSAAVRVGQSNDDQEAAGKMDYDVFAFGPNLGASPGLAAGFGTYEFCEVWRSGGGTFTCTTVPSNSTKIINVAATALFNGTGAWTWTDDNAYADMSVDWDYRLLQERDAGDAGTVPGAVQESVNATPTAGNVTYTATSGVQKTVNSTLGLLSNSSDPDMDTLTVSLVTSPSHGVLDTLNITTGAFEYTPNLTYTGTDTFTFKVSDGTTFSDSASAIITVSNQTPVISGPLNFSTTEDQQLTVAAGSGMLSLASDPDVGQTLSVTSVGTPVHGSLVYSTTTGAFTFTPDFAFVGEASWTYKVTDGNTLSDAGTVAIQVTASSPVVPPETITNLIDTAPFFRPTLEVQTEIRFKTKKNRRKHHDLADYTEDVVWEESTHRILNLATNTSTDITFGGVASAAYVMVETDNPITVSVNGTTTDWPVSGCVIALVDSVTSMRLVNSSTTLTAQVILSVVD